MVDLLRPADLFVEVDHAWGNRLEALRYQFLGSATFLSTATLYRSTYRTRERSRLRPHQTSNYSSIAPPPGGVSMLISARRAASSWAASASAAMRS